MQETTVRTKSRHVFLHARTNTHACMETGGCYASKLETVLVVEVPAENFRSAARIVPGRDDVFIIPQGSCEAGKLLKESDNARYYSNTHVKALLVLQPPSSSSQPTACAQRVHCKAHRADLQIAAIDNDAHVSDKLDSTVFPPRVLEYTGYIAMPVQTDFLALHRMIQRDQGNRQHFLENVARFSDKEMQAGIEAIDTELPRSYTIGFVFATREDALQTSQGSGFKAIKLQDGMRKLTVSLLSPADLGWTKNGAGQFRHRVAKLMDITPDDIQTVVVCAIPTMAIELAGCADAEKFVIQEGADRLKLLQHVQGSDADAEYSNAHIAKIYELEPAEVIEARTRLAELRAGLEGTEGKDSAKLERSIQLLLDEAQGSNKHLKCAKCRNGLLPEAEFCLRCGTPAQKVVRPCHASFHSQQMFPTHVRT